MDKFFKNNSGQVAIILLLTVLIGLAVGLTVTQRSINDVSNSNKAEQSSRAFSAAEAGIERGLVGDTTTLSENDTGNKSRAVIAQSPLMPITKSGVNQALEFTDVKKESEIQVWLTNPLLDVVTPPAGASFTGNTLEIYYSSDETYLPPTPAIVANVITKVGSAFKTNYFYFDKNATSNGNNFDSTSVDCSAVYQIWTTSSPSDLLTDKRTFKCKATMNLTTMANPGTRIMLRVRLLYTNQAQQLAVLAPSGGPQIPKQAKIITSEGSAQDSRKVLQLFSIPKVLPFFMDYSVFSIANINK